MEGGYSFGGETNVQGVECKQASLPVPKFWGGLANRGSQGRSLGSGAYSRDVPDWGSPGRAESVFPFRVESQGPMPLTTVKTDPMVP